MATEVQKTEKDLTRANEIYVVPEADIYETDNEYVIKAEMPGVIRENLDITLDNNELQIEGRVVPDYRKEEHLDYSEYRLYNFHRSFVVGDAINREGIHASLADGVLSLVLPKSEKVKPRKIEIKVEQ
jgi:HSP20 family molecular chaperone IbpA